MNPNERVAGGRRGGLGALLRRSPELGLLVAIAAALGLIYALEPSHAFFGDYSLRNFLHETALYGVLALGATVVIISGGIDLSVGSVVALAAVVAGRLMKEWLPGAAASGSEVSPLVIAGSVLIVLAMGLGIGLFHALMINRLQLPPFIATLATMAGLRSVANLVSKNAITIPFDGFRVFGSEMGWSLALFLALAAALTVLMGRTVRGRHLYALGGNEAAARLSGLPTRRLKGFAYGVAGMLSALGGLLFAGNTGKATWYMGNAYELRAITAAVVGGCSLAGGVGTVRGTVLGIILIQLVIRGTGIVVKGVDSSQIEGLVLGIVVVAAVAFNQWFRVRRG
jgi:ribose/xylose/arabinose/galactoside ABC-type transport system permease subunit